MLIPGGKLITKTGSFLGDRLGWSKRVDRLLGRARQEETEKQLDQAQMYEQFTQYIATLADRHPLLIVLDDLQWADSATLGLCFHLARRLADKPVLLLTTYRAHDLAPAADGSRHEILKLQYELSRIFGKILIDLDDVRARRGRQLIDQLIDREPNLLSDDFRDALFKKTGGSALFTVELVSMLKDGGVLVRDAEGRWIQSGALNWTEVPPRVEGIIAERLNRLSAESLELLRAAGTEGEDFTAEVAACVAGWEPRDAIRHLSEVLGRQEQLVEALDVQTAHGGRASRYRFSHALFRQQLLETLDAAERCYIHEAVAGCLPKVYGTTAGLEQQLASHLLEARLEHQALPYLIAAGDAALKSFANREAHAAYERAVRIVETGGAGSMDSDETARLYRRLSEVRLIIGRPEAARDAVSRALNLLDADAVAERVKLLCFEGNSWRLQNEERKALHAYQSASRLCAPDGEVAPGLSREWIETGIGQMWAYYFAGDTQNLEKVTAEFLPYSETFGSTEQQATLTHGKLLARMRRRRFNLVGDREALRLAAQLAENSRATERPGMMNHGVFINGLVLLFAENWDESRRYLLDSLQLSEKMADALGRARALAYLTVLERRVDNAVDAMAHAQKLKATAESSEQAAYLSVALAQNGWAAARNGDFSNARSSCEEAILLWSKRPVSYPLQWLAYWPLLKISLEDHDTDRLLDCIVELMRDDQQPVPEAIAELLENAAAFIERGASSQAFTSAAAALQAAETAGYF
jgi:hypothetical protein